MLEKLRFCFIVLFLVFVAPPVQTCTCYSHPSTWPDAPACASPPRLRMLIFLFLFFLFLFVEEGNATSETEDEVSDDAEEVHPPPSPSPPSPPSLLMRGC